MGLPSCYRSLQSTKNTSENLDDRYAARIEAAGEKQMAAGPRCGDNEKVMAALSIE